MEETDRVTIEFVVLSMNYITRMEDYIIKLLQLGELIDFLKLEIEIQLMLYTKRLLSL